MNKSPFVLILFLIALISCIAPVEKFQTQIPAGPTQTPSSPDAIPIQPVVEMLSIGDGGLISDIPCAAPCFFGITSGETSKDRVIPILEEQGFHQCIEDSENNIRCAERAVVSFASSTNIIIGIGYYPDSDISIEKLIVKHGDPDVVTVIPSGIPEAPSSTILLFFDKLNMRIRLPEVIAVDYPITKSTKVELVNYFGDTLYSEQRDSMFSQPWKGYGTYRP